MFEQIKSQNQNQPVEDIFSTTERQPNANQPPTLSPEAPLKPIQPAPSPTQPLTSPKEIQIEQEKPMAELKKKSSFLTILIIAVLVIILGILGYFVYNKYYNQPSLNQNTNNLLNNNQPATNNNQNVNIPPVPIIVPNQNINLLVDSDKDGLTDEEERVLGTDANEVDSDHDNSFDYEEVKVYQTDPLNPDTDGDGYLDGEEVQSGYNPKGPGKLLEFPQ